MLPLTYSQAQVAVGVGIGGPPVCAYGYYGYYALRLRALRLTTDLTGLRAECLSAPVRGMAGDAGWGWGGWGRGGWGYGRGFGGYGRGLRLVDAGLPAARLLRRTRLRGWTWLCARFGWGLSWWRRSSRWRWRLPRWRWRRISRRRWWTRRWRPPVDSTQLVAVGNGWRREAASRICFPAGSLVPPLVNLTGETPRCGRRDAAEAFRSPQELQRPSLRALTRPFRHLLAQTGRRNKFVPAVPHFLLECAVRGGCRGSSKIVAQILRRLTPL